jgi:uncharacterized protein (DUF1684 family)
MPTTPADPAVDPAARAALDAWRAAYLQRLAAPDGWWATCALHWLDDGVTRLGSGPDADLRLPTPCPAHVATLLREGPRVTVRPAAPDALWSDGTPFGQPAIVEDADRTFALGPAPDAPRFTVLVRGARRGVRAYDPARAAARDPATSVAWYPLEPGWVVPAAFVPADEGETVPIVTMQGDVLELPAAGRLRFRMAGEEHALLATWTGDDLFVSLRDAGSGPESYGAGRYLSVPAPVGGTTWLDFHRAHHPPCAHSAFATCPLPPLENRLPFVVRAGERTA